MFKIRTPLRGETSDSSANEVPEGLCSSADRTNSLDDIGPLILEAFGCSKRLEYISYVWKSSFGRTSCPLCDADDADRPHLPEDVMAPHSEEDRKRSAVQQVFSSPEIVDQSRHLDEWLWRGLSRLRQLPPEEESGELSSAMIDGTTIEELFAYDAHILRHGLGIRDAAFARSLGELLGTNPGGGKSKARFAKSSDGEYIVKSINSKEEQFLRKFGASLYQYYGEVLFHKRPSVLTPIVGVFTLKRPGWKSRMTLIVMPNLARGKHTTFFDLKGVGMRRKAKGETPVKLQKVAKDDVLGMENFVRKPDETLSESDSASLLPPQESEPEPNVEVLWDQDFREWCRNRRMILDAASFNYLKDALSNDSLFLATHQVIDYSLFASIENLAACRTISVGIIDFLRQFTWDKKLESVVKAVNSNLAQLGTLFSNADEQPDNTVEMMVAPTVIRPDLYAKRFVTNISTLFTSGDVADSS